MLATSIEKGEVLSSQLNLGLFVLLYVVGKFLWGNKGKNSYYNY